MNDSPLPRDALLPFERVHLERLRLAAEVILELGDAIPAPLEAELTIFKERVELGLLKQRLASASTATGQFPADDPSA